MKRTVDSTITGKRLQLLDAARGLFLKYGFLEVRAEDIARESGVSKRTLYQLHESLDDLTAAAVTHDFEAWREWFFDAVRERGRTGEGPLESFHTVLGMWMDAPGFSGCLFARALLCGKMLPVPVREAARPCAAVLHDYFLEQAGKARIARHESFARAHLVCALVLLGGVAGEFDAGFREELHRDVQFLFGRG